MQHLTIAYPEVSESAKHLVNVSVTPDVQFILGTAHFKAGSRTPNEGSCTHNNFEVAMVMEGELDVSANGVTSHLKAGDLVKLSPGEEHYSTALTDVKLVYVLAGKKP